MKSRTLDFHSGKTVDLSILRARMQESPRTASTGETPRQKMSKIVAPRDAKPDSARELTKSNLFSDPALRSLGTSRLFCLKVDKPRTSPDRKSGKAILGGGSFMLRND